MGDSATKQKRGFIDKYVLRKKPVVQPTAEDPAVVAARTAWQARAPEVKGVADGIADLARWGDANAAAFGTSLEAVRTKAANADYAQAGTDLDALKQQVTARMSIARVKREHQVSLAGIAAKTKAADAILVAEPTPLPPATVAPPTGTPAATTAAPATPAPATSAPASTAPTTAASVTPASVTAAPVTGPAAPPPAVPPPPPTPDQVLAAAVVTYQQTKTAAAAYAEGDDAATLKQRRDAWQAAGDALVAAYDGKYSGGSANSNVTAAMNAQSAGARERAGLVKPSSLAQETLKGDYESQARGSFTAAYAKALKADALLGATDVPLQGERAYVRLRAGAGPRITYAATLATPPEGLNTKQKTAYAASFTSFGTLRTAYTGADSALPAGTEADRFSQALPKLRAAADAADALIAQHAQAAKREVAGVAKKGSEKRSEAAEKFISSADPVLLQSLDAEDIVSILHSLRRAAQFKTDNPGKFDAAQVKVYKATKLDKGFLDEEKAMRQKLMAELAKDKKELKAARDEWPALGEADKLKVFLKLAKAHCKAMGFDEPAGIEFYDAAPGGSGAFAPGSRKIRVNRAGNTVQDFELMVDTIFHENSHNWQVQLSERIKGTRKPPVKKSDPLYKQALLFDVNEDDYNTGDAYKEQPQESHSFRAGPVTAKAMLKMLSS